MKKSPYYSRWTLRIKDEYMKTKYQKLKREEVFRNIVVIIVLQLIQNVSLVFIVVKTGNYARLINLCAYIPMLIMVVCRKRCPLVLDFGCVTIMFLKMVLFCYFQKQQLDLDREEGKTLDKMSAIFQYLWLIIIYMITT